MQYSPAICQMGFKWGNETSHGIQSHSWRGKSFCLIYQHISESLIFTGLVQDRRTYGSNHPPLEAESMRRRKFRLLKSFNLGQRDRQLKRKFVKLRSQIYLWPHSGQSQYTLWATVHLTLETSFWVFEMLW